MKVRSRRTGSKDDRFDPYHHREGVDMPSCNRIRNRYQYNSYFVRMIALDMIDIGRALPIVHGVGVLLR